MTILNCMTQKPGSNARFLWWIMALMQKKGDHRIRFKKIAPRPASSLLWQALSGNQFRPGRSEAGLKSDILGDIVGDCRPIVRKFAQAKDFVF